ncbi:MAG: FTR1 family iron permease [Candidatus Heimdallarchaeaceae archaeon]
MFSVASFLITLRETIEASLIIGILLVYVTKINQKKLKRQIWLGTIMGVVFSAIIAVIFQLVLGGFEQFEQIFEGSIMILVSLLLTWMIVWMMNVGKNIQKNIEGKIEMAIKEQQKYGLFSLALISVLREGIEMVLFLSGVTAVEESYITVLWSGVLGILVAIGIAIGIFYYGKKINLRAFFLITGVILIVIAAGMFTYGVHELQELGFFGPDTHWLQKIVYDISGTLNDETNELGKFLRTLLGYQDKPTWLELIMYISYYLSVGIIIMIIHTIRGRKRGEKNAKENV